MEKRWYAVKKNEEDFLNGSFKEDEAIRMAIRQEVPLIEVYYAECDEEGKPTEDSTFDRFIEVRKPVSIAIREFSKSRSRSAFARKYRIPLRTLEDWDARVNEAPAYVLDLLARAVISDLNYYPWFFVFSIKNDEWVELKTKNITEAISRAREIVKNNKETRQDYETEIRVFTSDPEKDENADYDIVNFDF